MGAERLREHPMLLARKLATLKHYASSIGITHNAILSAENRARADRDYLMPARWVRAYSVTTGLPPYVFRPDLYEPWMSFLSSTSPSRSDGND